VIVGGFLDDPEHHGAEQDDGGEFHAGILLAREIARPGSVGILRALAS
jgi:hypothetical protein